MFTRLVLLWIIMASMASSDDKMCGDPKFDSISYQTINNMWFATSQGKAWYFKHANLPPSEDESMQMPEGFTKGDAMVFVDKQKGCGEGDQIMIMTEMIGDTNWVIEFDTSTVSWVGNKRKWIEHPILKDAKVDANKEIKAMFAFETIIFIVQGNVYTAIDWKPICNQGQPKSLIDERQLDGDMQMKEEEQAALQAITYKDSALYIIFDKSYYILGSISKPQARKGIIQGNRGSVRTSVGVDLFKLEKCPEAPSLPKDDKGPEDNAIKETVPPNEPGGSSGSSIILVILGVVVVIVLALIIAFLSFGSTKKSTNKESKAEKAEKASKKPSAVTPKSNAGRSVRSKISKK